VAPAHYPRFACGRVLLSGDHTFELSQDSIVFAQPFGTTPSVLPSWLDHNFYGTHGADTLTGDSTDNWIRGKRVATGTSSRAAVKSR
jgi:hypothetical protein